MDGTEVMQKLIRGAIFLSLVGGFAVAASPAQAADSTIRSSENASCWYDFASEQSLCVGEDESLIDALRAIGVVLEVPTGTLIADEEVSAAASASASRGAVAAAAATVVAILYDDAC